MPPVRQLARPTSTYSTGVAPLSSEAKTSGWSASNENLVLWLCSAPRPKKPWTVDSLWVPLIHSQEARQVNWAACGASVSALRAPRRASTFTPLSTLVSAWAIGLSPFNSAVIRKRRHTQSQTGSEELLAQEIERAQQGLVADPKQHGVPGGPVAMRAPGLCRDDVAPRPGEGFAVNGGCARTLHHGIDVVGGGAVDRGRHSGGKPHHMKRDGAHRRGAQLDLRAIGPGLVQTGQSIFPGKAHGRDLRRPRDGLIAGRVRLEEHRFERMDQRRVE